MATPPTPRSPRTWQVIARELALETNSKRIWELSQELNEALEKRDFKV